jgi:hypothetical protein
MMGAHGGPSPPVALQVNKDSDQPGFLMSVTSWDGDDATAGCAETSMSTGCEP